MLDSEKLAQNLGWPITRSYINCQPNINLYKIDCFNHEYILRHPHALLLGLVTLIFHCSRCNSLQVLDTKIITLATFGLKEY